MVVRQLVAAGLIASFALGVVGAYAGNSYDGRWEGEAKPNGTGACSEPASLSFVISKGQFSQFAFAGPRGRARLLSAHLNEDGTATLEYGASRLRGTLQFKEASFSGTLDTLCGPREAAGQRVK